MNYERYLTGVLTTWSKWKTEARGRMERGEKEGTGPTLVGCQDTQGTLEWVGQKVCLNFSIPSYRKT